MAEAARIVEANGADIVDINMGCPAKKVTGGYSGSALMRDPDHALSLIEATVKARRYSGWSVSGSRTAVQMVIASAIAAMNTGRYDSLIDRFYYRYNGSVARLEDVGHVRDAGTPSDAEGTRVLTVPLAAVISLSAFLAGWSTLFSP